MSPWGDIRFSTAWGLSQLSAADGLLIVRKMLAGEGRLLESAVAAPLPLQPLLDLGLFEITCISY